MASAKGPYTLRFIDKNGHVLLVAEADVVSISYDLHPSPLSLTLNVDVRAFNQSMRIAAKSLSRGDILPVYLACYKCGTLVNLEAGLCPECHASMASIKTALGLPT